MNILVVNPIIYTSETKNITRVNSIKDTMIYDLCLAFNESGHNVTLFAAEPFKPEVEEEYPFKVYWGKCILKTVFMPHCFPLMPQLSTYINKNKEDIDLIITSEVFSMHSLISVLCANKKVIIWHELAKHNAMLKEIPSKVWYNIFTKLFMRKTRVIARSEDAYNFIRKYCSNVDDMIIEHGVNLDKFVPAKDKEKYFIVCSQLIARKRIDGILKYFCEYLKTYDNAYSLYIIGDGEKKEELVSLSKDLGIENSVIFTGKMSHNELLQYLAHAKALLVNTEKDNSMLSIIEAIAVGTPILTTEVPLNARYIKSENLGIARNWSCEELIEIVEKNDYFVANCLKYRKSLSTFDRVQKFVQKTITI